MAPLDKYGTNLVMSHDNEEEVSNCSINFRGSMLRHNELYGLEEFNASDDPNAKNEFTKDKHSKIDFRSHYITNR